MIIGRDLHTRYQQIALLDTDTGELAERAGGVPRSSRFLRRVGVGNAGGQVGFIACPQQNQIAHAASPPFGSAQGRLLQKNARMGHPRWDWCTQKSLKLRHLPYFFSAKAS